jgi:LysM repeat protein
MNRLARAIFVVFAAGIIVGVPDAALASPQKPGAGLHLTIITPDPNTISDRVVLDVSFRGSSIEIVELYIDGKLEHKRNLNVAHTRGVISFKLDANQYTAGTHEVVVKAFGPDGKPVSASAKLKIPAADLASPVRVSYPANGVEVNGIVPIRVFLESDLQRLKPYVTIFVNKDFQALKNYPPYEYAWDTTKLPNGWHVVEVWTQAPDAANPVKARPVHVRVNNGGGQTSKQDEIKDLRLNANAPKHSVDPKTAVTGSSRRSPGVIASAVAVPDSGVQPHSGTMSRTNEPSPFGYGATSSNSSARIAPVNGDASRIASRNPRMMGNAAARPLDRIVIASNPKPRIPQLSPGAESFPVVSPSPETNGNVKSVKPGETLASISRRNGIPVKELQRLNNLKKGAAPGTNLVMPRAGTFQVAFNGRMIRFDVQPRIEKGVKLSPFRQIFEHSGGKLYWYGEDKAVRAINATREIELRIGDATATVNNDKVKLERAPFVENGRTIVPITFVRDAMNVKISFDEKTGRLFIEGVK